MTCRKTDDGWACQLDEYAMERALAPEQPETVEAGQEWMFLATGSTLPVSEVNDGRIRLGNDSYIAYLREPQLRREYVCVDMPPLPDNVTTLPSSPDTTQEEK